MIHDIKFKDRRREEKEGRGGGRKGEGMSE